MGCLLLPETQHLGGHCQTADTVDTVAELSVASCPSEADMCAAEACANQLTAVAARPVTHELLADGYGLAETALAECCE